MISKIKKPVSILLSLIMVFSMFAIVPLSASAAVGDDLSEDDYLTFTAEEDGSTVTLKASAGSNFQYNLNNSGWESYNKGTTITLANVGDYVRFSGKDTKFSWGNHVSLTGKVAASGNVMSLRLDDDGKVQGLAEYCFDSMFSDCTGLTSAPELPETDLMNSCYYYMFENCTNLTKAPELPATNLAESCYASMFYGCTSLTELPALPATTLAEECYSGMFYGCTSLTELPALPATTLASGCYSYMFYGCTSLTELPALPATTLAAYCYYGMFYGCSKICISDEAGTFGDITYSAEYRIPTTGEGTSASGALSNMFGNTGGIFTTGTPDINTTYYVPAPETFKVYVKKLTGGTYTIENLTGETTVAQLKEIIADQIDIPATAQRLIFAGKQLEDAKTLAEYNIGEESTIHLVIRGYTVTWLDYDNSELGTTTVQYGATPSYDGEEPTKDEDDDYTYTFIGWTDENNTFYALDDDLPAVTADVTYTATFDATPKAVPAELTLSVGEHGKVVMNNGVFGTATSPDKILKVTTAMNVVNHAYLYYTNGYSANVEEGGAINIATGGKVKFNPSADSTGVITAIPDEGYVCIGWYNGDTLYSSEATLAYQTISEDMTLTAKFEAAPAPEPDIFTKHSITLNGTVDENFFLDPEGAGYTVDEIASGAKTISVSFEWDESFSVYSDLSEFNTVINSTNYQQFLQSGDMAGQFMVTCKVAAAEMTCGVKATATVSDGTNDLYTQEDTYSVSEYCWAIINSPANTFEKQTELVELAKAMLVYGAKAQLAFGVKTDDLADANLNLSLSEVTGQMIDSAIKAANNNQTADDMTVVATALGGEYKTTSLIFLDKHTLRHYFYDVDASLFNGENMGCSDDFYYYVQKTGIAAAELDDLQTFTVGTVSFKYSALDYVKALLNSGMDQEYKDLATATYWYNQAANAYFD